MSVLFLLFRPTLCAATPSSAPPPPPPSPLLSSPYVRGLLGGVAYGVVAAAISHPFDTLKTGVQTGAGSRASATLFGRVAGLYRGVGPATAASILFRSVPFMGYEATRSALHSRQLLEAQPLCAAFLGGVVGGVMRGFLETPAELIKTRMQVGATWNGRLLLRGLSSTCLRNGAVIGLFWVLFEASKSTREALLPPLISSFAAGGGCSVLAWAAIFPLDTAKSRIQAAAADAKTGGVVAQLAMIYRSQGVRGWYAGIGAGLLRAFLANGGGMAIYALIQMRLAQGGKAEGKAEL